MNRRKFLQSAAFGTAAIAGASVTNITPNKAELNKILVPSSHSTKHLGLRIGFIADIHLGPYLNLDIIKDAVRQFNLEDLDLLFLGGDYIYLEGTGIANYLGKAINPKFAGSDSSSTAREIFQSVSKILSTTKTRLGIYGILGNHDRWINGPLCLEEFSRAGIRMLVNESSLIKVDDNFFIELVGVDDYWTGQPTIPNNLNAHKNNIKNENLFSILLSHNPDFVSNQLKKTDYNFDLAVCGHTHGGQIRLPLIGAIAYSIQDRRFNYGLIDTGKSYVYTTSGIGFVGLPIRFNCPPEIVVFEI